MPTTQESAILNDLAALLTRNGWKVTPPRVRQSAPRDPDEGVKQAKAIRAMYNAQAKLERRMCK